MLPLSGLLSMYVIGFTSSTQDQKDTSSLDSLQVPSYVPTSFVVFGEITATQNKLCSAKKLGLYIKSTSMVFASGIVSKSD